MPQSATMPPNLIRMKEIVALTGLHRTAIIRMKKRGTFPASRMVPGYGAVYQRAAVMQWISAVGGDTEQVVQRVEGPAMSTLVSDLEALVKAHGHERVSRALALLAPIA